jgi:hypothetical protein
MFLDTDPFNPLLGHGIARCEENLKIDTHRSWVSLHHPGCLSCFHSDEMKEVLFQKAG